MVQIASPPDPKHVASASLIRSVDFQRPFVHCSTHVLSSPLIFLSLPPVPVKFASAYGITTEHHGVVQKRAEFLKKNISTIRLSMVGHFVFQYEYIIVDSTITKKYDRATTVLEDRKKQR